MPSPWGNPKRVRRLAHCSRLSRSQGLGLAAYRHQRFKLIEALSTDPLRREPLKGGPNAHAPEAAALHGNVPGPSASVAFGLADSFAEARVRTENEPSSSPLPRGGCSALSPAQAGG